MGFQNSICSFSRFRVLDPVSDELVLQIPDLLRKYAFREIDELPEMSAWGWSCFDDMFDTEWSAASPKKGDAVFFSLRLDIRRIPAGVIRKYMALAIKEEIKKLKESGKTYIARERKKEIREQVLFKLKKHFLPVPGEFNVVWSIANNEIWFASTQTKIIDLFMEQFLKTFNLHLEHKTPYVLAQMILGEENQEKLDSIEETNFAITRP